MIKRDEKYRYLIKNTLLFSISSFGSRILTFLFIPLYTNILSTKDYGTADLINTTAGILGYIFSISIASAVVRFSMENINESNKILVYGFRVLVRGSLLLSILIIFIWKLRIFQWDDYCYLFLFLFYFFPTAYDILSGYFRAIGKVEIVALSGIILTATTIASNIFLLIVIKTGLIGYLISIVGGHAVASVFFIVKAGGFWNSGIIPPDMQKSMRQYSLPLVFNGIAWWVSAGIDRYFIVWERGFEDNGIYTVATKIPTIASTVLNMFLQAWNLSAIKEYDKNDTDGFYSKMHVLFNTIGVLLSSVLIVLNIPLAKILFAKDFFVAWKCASILLVSALFSGLSSFEGGVLSAVKKTSIIGLSTAISALVNIVLNFILIPLFGIEGAAVATVTSFFSVWTIRRYYSGRYIAYRYNLIRDFVAYALLIIQVFLEHCDGHFYLLQALIFGLIIWMYRAEEKELGMKLVCYVKSVK